MPYLRSHRRQRSYKVQCYHSLIINGSNAIQVQNVIVIETRIVKIENLYRAVIPTRKTLRNVHISPMRWPSQLGTQRQV